MTDFLDAARTFYDTIAADYANLAKDELTDKPLDRALFAAFAELVGEGPVADVGCGPGVVTAYLYSLGLDAFGVDLSAEMISIARESYPNLRFDVGSMLALNLPDDTLAGLVANYSIIHIPDDRLPAVFAEFRRVLRPGAHALLVFQVGDEPKRVSEPLGHPVSLDFSRRQPEQVAELLTEAGLTVTTRVLREPSGDRESVPQGYLLVRKA